MKRIDIRLPHHAYEVLIGAGLIAETGSHVHELAPHGVAALLGDQTVDALYGAQVEASLIESGYRVVREAFHSGEEQKHIQTVSELYEKLVLAKAERRSPILALGGGVAGDLVGFVAATYLRGVPFIQLPTTLLAMVDASVGGKVGYNLPQGKNLIGAFYQPQAVLIDPLVLQSLPAREYRCGLAECIKHAVLGDAPLFQWTLDHADKILAQDPQSLAELIARNVQIKADIVMADEFEAGVRAHLNLGHTFGHAIEATAGYGTYLHGEAVALGLCAAASFAAARGIAAHGLESSVRNALSRVGLPTQAELPPIAELLAAMQTDKKVKDGRVRLILPTDIGSVTIVNDAAPAEITAAFDSIRC